MAVLIVFRAFIRDQMKDYGNRYELFLSGIRAADLKVVGEGSMVLLQGP